MDDETKKIRGHVERLYTCAVRLNFMARHADDGMVDSAIAADNQRSLRIVADAILAHIDGEPARLTAKAEEVREALGLDRWPVLIPFIAAMVQKLNANRPKKGGREGWRNDDPSALVRRVIEEAEELEHAVDTQPRGLILAEAADVANMALMVADAAGALDATPLDARPLADRIEELEKELSKAEWRVAELEDEVADARILLEPHFGQETYQLPLAKTTAGLIGRTEKAEARVEELEQQKDDLKTMIQGLRGRAEKAEAWVAELKRALADAVAIAREFDARQQKAEAERDEAVAALRRLVGASAMLLGRFQRLHDSDVLREVNEQPTDDALEQARAVLAKYPEGKR